VVNEKVKEMDQKFQVYDKTKSVEQTMSCACLDQSHLQRRIV
jgi:hypothetical protein